MISDQERTPFVQLVAAIVTLALLTPTCAAQGKAAARTAWQYNSEGKNGWFLKDTGKRWLEETPDGGQFFFEEVERADAFVELFDRSRTMSLRLFADHMEWRQGEKGKWNTLYTGKWVAQVDVPKPKTPDYRIRLAYFVPTDREPTADYEKKVRVLIHFVAEVYRQDFGARGIKSDGLRFETKDGQPVVHLVHGRRPAVFYNRGPDYDPHHQWDTILPEMPTSVGLPTRNLLIIFAETYDSEPGKFEWPGGVALGSRLSTDGGVGLFSAWILRPEFCATTVDRQKELLFDPTPIKGRTALGHGGKDSPRFEFIEDGFGAVAHELGHALGLPHDTRRDDLYIMGNGFRNLRFNFEAQPDPRKRVRFSDDNARILYTSRFLAKDCVLTDRWPPSVKVDWAGPLKAGAKQVTVSVSAADEEGLRAILFYSPAQDSVVGGRALQGKEHKFEQTLEVRALRAGPYRLTATVADAGGNLTQVELKGNVEK